MECPRCKSVMIEERFQDLADDTGVIHFFGYRCLSCGEILDPVIAYNRTHPTRPLQGRGRHVKVAA
ncbi:MAG: hypothetical protein HY282_11560 [Nitrospirae bacterium]|nr:hypothetical protein [Candidatus Manganitrophaceae bacterium]